MVKEYKKGFLERRRRVPSFTTRAGMVGQVEIHRGDVVIADASPGLRLSVASVAESGIPTVVGRKYIPAGWQVTVKCPH